jgi:hypothetical protein
VDQFVGEYGLVLDTTFVIFGPDNDERPAKIHTGQLPLTTGRSDQHDYFVDGLREAHELFDLTRRRD